VITVHGSWMVESGRGLGHVVVVPGDRVTLVPGGPELVPQIETLQAAVRRSGDDHRLLSTLVRSARSLDWSRALAREPVMRLVLRRALTALALALIIVAGWLLRTGPIVLITADRFGGVPVDV
jgi:hypothetical protein